MKSTRRIFLFSSLLFTVTFYLFVLGEAGILMRNGLVSDLERLDQRIVELESENDMLRDRYITLFQKKPDPDSANAKQAAESDVHAVILKFDRNSDSDESPSLPTTILLQSGSKLTLNRLRVLFPGLMFIIIIGGYIFLRKPAHLENP